MKKKNYEELGELERIIYDYLQTAVKENTYTLEVENDVFASDGYIGAKVIIGGVVFPCSVNIGNYICWHCDMNLEKLIRDIPDLVKKVVSQTKRIVKDHENEWKDERIKKLEAELKKLKK